MGESHCDHHESDNVFDIKLKLLKTEFNGEFNLIKVKLKNIEELLKEKKTFFTRINASVVICVVSSLIAVVFEIIQKIAK